MSIIYETLNSDLAKLFLEDNKGHFTEKQEKKLRDIMKKGTTFSSKGSVDVGKKIYSQPNIQNSKNLDIVVETIGYGKEIIDRNGGVSFQKYPPYERSL